MDNFGATPVQELHSETGNRLFVKREDLLPFSLGGNKVRIAKAFLDDMKMKGKNALIMYGNDRSNLCRVLSSACFAEKIPCLMVCSDDPDHTHTVTGNSRLIGLFGVEVLRCAKNAVIEGVRQIRRTKR